MQLRKALGFALFALTAQAANAADISADYGAVLGKYVYPDASRDAAYGAGWHLLYGFPLSRIGIQVESLDAEVNAFGYLTERETSRNNDYGYGGGVDLRYPLVNDRNYGLFFLGGIGALAEDIKRDRGISPYFDAGFSLNLWNIFSIPNLSLRTDARYYGTDRKDSSRFNNPAFKSKSLLNDAHFNLGLQLNFAGAGEKQPPGLRDSDGDGVIDTRDECPGTPTGTAIDGHGCPLPVDSDGDGIVDEADKCPSTPAGVAVDADGCPAAAPPHPAAALPPPDSDNDGVLDLTDECPGTPAGTPVDTRGCPLPRDLDGDGVLNADDLCPDTPPNMKVDSSGCVIKQTVVFNNINFEPAKDELTNEAKKILDGIAEGLKGQPTMEVEIGGHTDSLGTQSYNLTLSQQRALAVKAYLIGKGISPSRLQAEGYGEFNPIADNNSEAGRAKNRRVEFKINKQ